MPGLGGFYATPFAWSMHGPNERYMRNPFTEGFDQNLWDPNALEIDNGRPAMGLYSQIAGGPQSFQRWLNGQGGRLWGEYQGQASTRQGRDTGLNFFKFLQGKNLGQEWAGMSSQERGESPLSSYSPFVRFLGG